MKFEMDKEETTAIVDIILKAAESNKQPPDTTTTSIRKSREEEIQRIIEKALGDKMGELTVEQRLELAEKALEALKGVW